MANFQPPSDVEVTCGDQSFLCHRAALVAASPDFQRYLLPGRAGGLIQRWQFDLSHMHPEAVKIMLEFIYTGMNNSQHTHSPGTQVINTDVLYLSLIFGLPGLESHAKNWRLRDVKIVKPSTGIVVNDVNDDDDDDDEGMGPVV